MPNFTRAKKKKAILILVIVSTIILSPFLPQKGGVGSDVLNMLHKLDA